MAHRSCLGGEREAPGARHFGHLSASTPNLPPWKFKKEGGKKRIIIKTKVCLIRHVYFADNLLGIKVGGG